MNDLAVGRLRKVTDVNRKHPLFELLVNDVVLLDIGFSNKEQLEVAFNQGIVGWIVDWIVLREWIEKGRAMAEQERMSANDAE